MTQVTIATFNCENLFRRFQFKGKPVKKQNKTIYVPWTKDELAAIIQDGFEIDKLKFSKLSGEMRHLTASAIKATNADVIALQEVENLETLKMFNAKYLAQSGYRYKLLIDGNDPRLIDVAVLSRYPFARIVTHQYRRTPNNKSYVFSRDCLEVVVQVDSSKTLHMFINHLKSMIGGRSQTMNKRKIQSEELIKILMERFGNNPGQFEWVVLGDLNDYLPSSGLAPLLSQPWLENIIQTRIPDPNERWTHYWDENDEYRQLDYVLLSQVLARKNPNAIPVIERQGLPLRASRYKGKHFKGVGNNKPKASDHCPVSIKLEL
jgi:endonuclease/exonuclease/phosphatase family metal-dependent hydrolase